MNKRYCAVNNWLIDISSGSILHLTSGERKRLGEYQLKLLDTLTQHAGKILTREELTTLVWEHRVIGNNSLPNAIHALRTALEDDGKQQKIIKTIPRKGYVLEADYCSVIEKEEDEVTDKSDDALLSEAVLFDNPQPPKTDEMAELPFSPEPASGTADAQKPAPAMARAPRWQRFPTIALIAAVALIVTAFATWRYFEHAHHLLQYQEQESNVYSNIHLFEIYPAGHLNGNQDRFYSELKDTLYQMNQLLKGQSIMMNVYYQSIDQTLNYTFSLKSRCDSKQLAMAIYHWRIDISQLNNLILRETRRKIAEMEECRIG
ncbi:winged helix-turn-helix domain-containing protein [Cedecea neteri]|uniref:transcriptional regulator n=1 Tax=Cedecea neteri TaxID=158822 RepID=UPI002AA85647|nr:winged helix-turn-helix domain-containing protein [Cedecea neteri]WPU21870.1 winged helix-turn-helix domain-containing protein [Cedecea neteri]